MDAPFPTLEPSPKNRRMSAPISYLVSATGQPYKETSFGNWFRHRCNEAGLKQCSAQGLRKAGAMIAGENGATAHQLMTVNGWEKLKQAELYPRQANKTLLAAQAMHLGRANGAQGRSRTTDTAIFNRRLRQWNQ